LPGKNDTGGQNFRTEDDRIRALPSDPLITEPRITIAGQTAPGGGITVRDQTLIVAADDVVIRLRMRFFCSSACKWSSS
jgi:hypothetical protein